MVAVVLTIGTLVGPTAWSRAGAHTEVLRASPAPGEEVAGPVDEVSLTFLDPVQPEVTIDIAAELGDAVTGLSEVEVSDGGRIATVTLPAVTDPGDYVVEYRFTAEDGDTQRETFRFTVVAAPDEDEDDRGGIGAVVGGGAVVAVLLAGVVGSLLRRRGSA